MKKRVNPGYWQDTTNLERELKPIIEKLGHFPTQDEIYEEKRYDISSAISRLGGYNKVRMNLNFEMGRNPTNYW